MWGSVSEMAVCPFEKVIALACTAMVRDADRNIGQTAMVHDRIRMAGVGEACGEAVDRVGQTAALVVAEDRICRTEEAVEIA
jgi:hypothetical protein